MKLLRSHKVLVGVVCIIALGLLFAGYRGNGTQPDTITTDTGTVTAFISVSGNARVEDIIPLSFPRGGTVSGIFVTRGDSVATGTILATVGDTSLQTEYAAALAETTRTRALRDELLNGQTENEAAVTDTTLKNAEAALSNTIKTEAAKVESARTTLYSTGLSALATDPDTEGVPPTVSGSYLCTGEGTYTLELYRSAAESGYSYRYSGIETGTESVATNQSSPLGRCGLRLQFPADARYPNGTTFTIAIPNTASPSYTINRALYDQARAQEDDNINAARRALDLALDQATISTAGARVEELIAANAVVRAAEARLAQTAFALSESAIQAPRSGVITDIDIVTGQTVTAAPALTLYTPRKTTFTARIPEKDITDIAIGQAAELTFDAKPDTTIRASVSFISPIQTLVSGAPYYETELTLDTTPVWLRSGMQADTKIITEELRDVVRIPRIYLDDNSVYTRTANGYTEKQIDVLLVGTDGYVAVSGISAETELIIPPQ